MTVLPSYDSFPSPRHPPDSSSGSAGMDVWPLVAAIFLILLFPHPAQAMQAHHQPEGLVAHQLGHILFASGMLFLLVRSRLSRWSGPGWARFKGFLWLAVAWNVLTFTGHFLALADTRHELTTAGGQVTALAVNNFSGLVFYFSEMDHLLLVPALLLLVLALRQWMQASEGD